MPKIKIPKEKVPKTPKFQRLDACEESYVKDVPCENCKKNYVVKGWDTIFGGQVHRFCSGECLFLSLQRRTMDISS